MAFKKLLAKSRPLIGLLLIGIFLIFSYCPVRTTLFSLLNAGNHLPAKKGSPEIKTSTYQICSGYAQHKLTFISYNRLDNHSPLPLLFLATTILLWLGLIKKPTRFRFKPPAINFHPVPIYLINRVLII